MHKKVQLSRDASKLRAEFCTHAQGGYITRSLGSPHLTLLAHFKMRIFQNRTYATWTKNAVARSPFAGKIGSQIGVVVGKK